MPKERMSFALCESCNKVEINVMRTADLLLQWRIQDLVKGGQMWGSRGLPSPAGSGAEPQPLAHFCYLKVNFERSEALQVLNFYVQCVCCNQKLTIILFIQKCSH